jgi:hypothetical protein
MYVGTCLCCAAFTKGLARREKVEPTTVSEGSLARLSERDRKVRGEMWYAACHFYYSHPVVFALIRSEIRRAIGNNQFWGLYSGDR